MQTKKRIKEKKKVNDDERERARMEVRQCEKLKEKEKL